MRQRMMVANGFAFGNNRTGKPNRKNDGLTLSDILSQILPTAWHSRRSIPPSSQQVDSLLETSGSVCGELGEEEKIKLYNRQFDPYS